MLNSNNDDKQIWLKPSVYIRLYSHDMQDEYEMEDTNNAECNTMTSVTSVYMIWSAAWWTTVKETEKKGTSVRRNVDKTVACSVFSFPYSIFLFLLISINVRLVVNGYILRENWTQHHKNKINKSVVRLYHISLFNKVFKPLNLQSSLSNVYKWGRRSLFFILKSKSYSLS